MCDTNHEQTHHENELLTPEQTLALMEYMLDHNKSHASELQNIVHSLESQGRSDAAVLTARAVQYFNESNDKLETALKIVRGE